MLRKRIRLWIAPVIALAGIMALRAMSGAQAQEAQTAETFIAPYIVAPAIADFSGDRAGISVPEAEIGAQTVTLSWAVVGLTPDHSLALETYRGSVWEAVAEDDQPLQPAGSLEVPVLHPLNYGPPTYRLSILNAEGDPVDQRTHQIAWITICESEAAIAAETESTPEAAESTPEPACQEPAPEIAAFTTSTTGVDANALANGTARIDLAWNVLYRPARSLLTFEQITPDGGLVTVELPRESLWVNSNGAGVAAPVWVDGDPVIRLQMRLVDLLDQTEYAAAEVSIPVTGTLTSPTPTPNPPTPTPRPNPPALTFTAAPDPVQPTGTVTVTWDARGVTGAASVRVEWFSRSGGNPSMQAGLPLNGSLTIPVSEIAIVGTEVSATMYPIDAAGNYLYDAAGTMIYRVATVRVATAMRIESFTVTPNPAPRQATLTFTWNVPGAASVALIRQPYGAITSDYTEFPNLPASGSTTLTLPADALTTISYRLRATDSAGAAIDSLPVTVSIQCPFATYISPACPLSQEVGVSAAYQAFENGLMVWLGSTRVIYVLYNDGSYELFSDTWTQGETFDIGEQPPAGRFQPQRGFGKVWATNDGVRSRLGWALTDIEASYTTHVEVALEVTGRVPNRVIYLRLPDGGLLRVSEWPALWSRP